MGLSTVTGVCTKEYGCVIGEMGVRDKNQKPYPSTGSSCPCIKISGFLKRSSLIRFHISLCDGP